MIGQQETTREAAAPDCSPCGSRELDGDVVTVGVPTATDLVVPDPFRLARRHDRFVIVIDGASAGRSQKRRASAPGLAEHQGKRLGRFVDTIIEDSHRDGRRGL